MACPAAARQPALFSFVAGASLEWHLNTVFCCARGTKPALRTAAEAPEAAAAVRALEFLEPGTDDDARHRAVLRAWDVGYAGAVRETGAGLGSAAASKDRSDPAWAEANRARGQEYRDLYLPNGYDPAANEVDAKSASRMARAFRLRPSDVFCDLGCAEGRLAVAVAAVEDIAGAGGIELGRARAKVAGECAAALADSLGGTALAFEQGSIPEAPGALLAGATVFYCAVRGPGTRPRLVADAVAAILAARAEAGAGAAPGPVRLFCAGFDVDDGAGAELRGGFAVGRPLEDDAKNGKKGIRTGVPLYTEKAGPRVVLEYEIVGGGAKAAAAAAGAKRKR